jgi:hypothetical protein
MLCGNFHSSKAGPQASSLVPADDRTVIGMGSAIAASATTRDWFPRRDRFGFDE